MFRDRDGTSARCKIDELKRSLLEAGHTVVAFNNEDPNHPDWEDVAWEHGDEGDDYENDWDGVLGDWVSPEFAKCTNQTGGRLMKEQLRVQEKQADEAMNKLTNDFNGQVLMIMMVIKETDNFLGC